MTEHVQVGWWLQQRIFIKSTLKKWFEEIVESNRKTLHSNWRPLKKYSATSSTLLVSENLYQVGATKIDWWDKCWQSQNLKGKSWLFWGEEFQRWIVTGDEAWDHHRDPQNERQPMEYRHKESPAPKQFKTKASLGSAMLTVFWNYESLALTSWRKVPQWTQNAILKTYNVSKNSSGRRGRKRWRLASTRPCEVWNCRHNSRHCTFVVYIATSSSPDLTSSDFREFPELKETSKAKTSVLVKKSRLQCTSGFGRKKQDRIKKHVKFGQNCIEVGRESVANW